MQTTPNSLPISYDFMPEAVIIGGGDFPTHNIPLSLLEKTSCIISLDGATETCLRKGIKPWRIVGDCDSLTATTQELYAECLRKNPDQETNDQTKGVRYLMEKGLKRIAIVGATGKREDHTLGNISLLIDYMLEGAEVRIYTDYGIFFACSNTASFACPVGTAVSIFSFGAKQMKAEGLEYPLRDFTSWWQGTLNATISPTFKINCKGSYLVFMQYPTK